MSRQGIANAALPATDIEHHARVTPEALRQLDEAIEALGLSARAWHRGLRLARTIADLAASEPVEAAHVAEAVALRALDRTTAVGAGPA